MDEGEVGQGGRYSWGGVSVLDMGGGCAQRWGGFGCGHFWGGMGKVNVDMGRDGGHGRRMGCHGGWDMDMGWVECRMQTSGCGVGLGLVCDIVG